MENNIQQNNNLEKDLGVDEVLYCDMGSRGLTDNEIERIKYIIDPIYNSILSYETMDNATRKIVYMSIMEDVKFESIYQLYSDYPPTPSTLKIIENTYKNPKKAQKLNPLHIILTNSPDANLDRKTAHQIEKNIKEILEGDPYQDMIIVDHNSNISYINNTRLKRIEHITHREINGKDYSKTRIIINAAITKLIIYDNPLDEEPRQFKATFQINHRTNPLTIGPMLTDEIIDFLIDSGYVEARFLVKDVLPAIFNQYIQKDKAITKNKIEYPGFYHNNRNNKIINIDYTIIPITLEELKDALKLLEEFASYFKGEEVKVAHILKWGLISPFIFAVKQKGRWINHLYLFGKAGSGKTTLADMILYLWNTPDSNVNNIGGSSFNTEARVGEKLRQFTFPIVVNEPQGTLEKPAIVEMIKSSIERTNSRGKFNGRTYKNILALAPVIYTSNHNLPSDDALIRRMECLSFTYNERKSEKQKEQFQRRFNMENHTECQLHQLKALAQYFTKEIIDNPKYLDLNWKELTNILINRAYIETGQKTPPWLLKWDKTTTLEDMDEILIEDIRIFLQKEINEAYGRITLRDEEGRPQRDNFDGTIEVKNSEDFYNRVWAVINNRQIPYIYIGQNDKIYLTSGFIKALNKNTEINETLKSIGELLQWNHGTGKIKGIHIGRNINVRRKEFTEFIFPTIKQE
jgi:hypothetical protein